ncbi:MAG: secretin N-terminal domain-containing protein [Acidobacteriota bacterium]
MFSTKMKVFTILVLTVSLTSLTLGQTPAPPPQQRQPEYVEEKGFKGRVFEIKHRNPSALISAIGPLGSGFKGATLRASDEFNTITVRDFPENIAAMEEALKRLDVPDAPSPDIEFHVHVLIASNAATTSGEFPAELTDVVKQLKATLSYKNYGMMTSSIQRTKEGRGRTSGSGVAESKLFDIATPQNNPIFFSFSLFNTTIDKTASGAMAVRMEELSFQMRVPLNVGSAEKPTIQYQDVGFRTPVSVRDGEKVVVGTTAIADKGLVVVLIAKFLK